VTPAGQIRNNTLQPIVKMMSISKRPQRYDKCFIKETDVLMERRDISSTNMAIIPKLPARLVMNDKTITAYQDDTFVTKLYSSLLKDIAFVRVPSQPLCFKLKSLTSEQLFCQLDGSNGNFIEEWDYDLNLFKNQCQKKRKRAKNSIDTPGEQEKLQGQYNQKLNSLKLDIISEKAEVLKKVAEKDEEVKLTSQVDDLRSTSMIAIQKELKLEDLLEKEESSKETAEVDNLTTIIKEEKKKKKNA